MDSVAINQKNIVVRPALDTSRGHDILAYMISAALDERGQSHHEARLKPVSAGLVESNLWGSIEKGKAKLANGNSGSTFINGLANVARNSNFINSALLTTYAEELAGLRKGSLLSIISSHYMAFVNACDRGTFVAPDFFPQPPVAEAIKKGLIQRVLSSTDTFTNSLLNSGVPAHAIEQCGVVVPSAVALAGQQRLSLRTGTENVFASIGGSAPEAQQMYLAVRGLVARGISTTVLCGDNQPRKIDFRNSLDEVRKGLPNPDLLTLLGGTAESSRTSELLDFYLGITNASITHLLTRPNETSVLGSNLGLGLLTLSPYQVIEEQAYAHLQRQPNFFAVGDGNFRGRSLPAQPQHINAIASSFVLV